MAISLPYPYPNLDEPGNPWDSFALLRNLQFLAERIDAVISVNQLSTAVRSAGNPITNINGTSTETTVFTTSILATTFGTTHAMQFVLSGDVLNNTGVSRGFTLRLYFGGTVFATFASTGLLTTSATRRGWQAIVNLSASNSVVNQFAIGECRIGAVGVGGTSVAVAANLWSTHNNLAIDTASAQTLAITIQPEVSDAQLSIRIFSISGILL